ncbi:hypothetical protein [Spiroplasma endosymbiont of Aspidapion aeneum]|uniref:hypothetical protein n=1 Tax=Spiroplasma endosymbiont of Aspidapion aeneum TaxID=3066276 RepID=UPI00313C7266
MNLDKKIKTQNIRMQLSIIENIKKAKLIQANDQFRFIENNILFIKEQLKLLNIDIKKHGRYKNQNTDMLAIDIENKKTAVIDLLAIKYVSKQKYLEYKNHNEVETHPRNCYLCQLKKRVFAFMNSKYRNLENISIEFKSKTISGLANSKKYQYFDSINVVFNCQKIQRFEQIIINIRCCLQSKNFPIIICNEMKIEFSFSLQFLSNFRKLNAITHGYLRFLFFEIDSRDFTLLNIKERKSWEKILLLSLNKKQWLFIKYGFMSYMIKKIINSDYLKKWMAYVYNNNLTDENLVTKIFEDKNFRYKKISLFDKILKSLQLENFGSFTNKIWESYNHFWNDFKEYVTNIYNPSTHKILIEKIDLEFLLENQVLITFDQISQSYTLKNSTKYFEETQIKIRTANIYADGVTGEKMVLFSIFYEYKFNNESKYRSEDIDGSEYEK